MTELTTQTVQGLIEISPLAIARLASHAVLQSYGIVGMAAPNLASAVRTTGNGLSHALELLGLPQLE